MCKHHSNPHAHGSYHGSQHHHDHTHEHDHHHVQGHPHYEHAHESHEREPDVTHAGGSSLSAREKLVVRLEHYIRHNRDHADFLEKLLSTVRELGVDAIASEIRAAAECAARQNDHLERALGAIRSTE